MLRIVSESIGYRALDLAAHFPRREIENCLTKFEIPRHQLLRFNIKHITAGNTASDHLIELAVILSALIIQYLTWFDRTQR